MGLRNLDKINQLAAETRRKSFSDLSQSIPKTVNLTAELLEGTPLQDFDCEVTVSTNVLSNLQGNAAEVRTNIETALVQGSSIIGDGTDGETFGGFVKSIGNEASRYDVGVCKLEGDFGLEGNGSGQNVVAYCSGAPQAIELTRIKVIKDVKDLAISTITDEFGNDRKVRLLTWVSGRVWSSVNPQLDSLRFSLGEQCGLLTNALLGLEHPEAEREFEWDVAQSLWTKSHIDLFSGDEKEIITYFQKLFELSKLTYDSLRKSVVHNDANDNNVIVSEELINPTVKAAIDYGDAVYTQIINDVAIACYTTINHPNPLEAALPIVKGYHSSFPLTAKELSHLYNAIAMRLVISVTKSAMNKIAEPDNEYLLISEKPSWNILRKWRNIHPDFAEYSFRAVCGYNAHPNEEQFNNWASDNTYSLIDLFPTINKNETHHIDMSVSSDWIGHQEDFNNLDLLQFKIDQLQKEVPSKIIAGGYLEPRALYTSTAYDTVGNSGRESRSIHLGIDYWLPEYTPVHAIIDGEVVIAINDEGDKEYGGLVVLKHKVNNFYFYTLYGHNTVESAIKHNVGDTILKGEKIVELANYPENGNWVPHLHFQVMLSTRRCAQSMIMRLIALGPVQAGKTSL